MILRRFTQHIKEQNWFAVGLDVIVVIVGIFLGIQVTNWQETINEDIDSQEYLTRLYDDLHVDLDNILYREKYWNQVLVYSNKAMVYLQQPDFQPVKPWPYLLAVFQSSQITPFEMSDITYRELQQTGQMLLIRDKILRQELAEYYSFNNGVAAESLLRANPPYRNYIRGLIPTDISEYIWSHCIEGDGIGTQVLIPCDAPITEIRSSEVLTTIREDENALRLLRSWYNTNHAAIGLLAFEKTLITSLILSLETMIKDQSDF